MIGVVMLVNEFPPLSAGGAEVQAERLAAYLSRKGLKVRVVTRGAAGLPAHEERSGFWIERIPQLGPGKMKTLSFMAGAIRELWRCRREYAIFHAHLSFAPAVVAAFMGRLLGKRLVVKFGNSSAYGDVQVSQRTWRGRLRLTVLRHWVDAYIALSAEMEAELLGAGFPRARIIRMVNGIDAEAFHLRESKAAAKAKLDLADKATVLFVGRLTTQKALPTLLQALGRAVVDCPQLHLMLVGDGPDRPALERQVHDLGLDGYVTFVGKAVDVRPYLNAADMFVLPSAAEGISNALLEAMAAGLACVATMVGGSPEVLEGGACGVLLPPERPDLLHEAMIRLAHNPEEAARLGRLARNRILSRYDYSIVGEQYHRLYERLLSEKAGAPAPLTEKI
jgi:glycosyltransferase involved in cell wall biosynthesis